LSSAGGVKGYCLENEPGIWHNTHPLNHPIKATCAEVISKNSSLAKRIKTLDPQAETFGPGMFGFSEYTHLNSQGAWGNPNYYPADWNTYNMSNVVGFNAANYNYITWVCSYLRQMKIASDSEGKRLLDGLDIHFYNQGNNVYQDSRSFWDPTYVENSWITNDVIGGQPLHLVHYLQKAINSYYPDTKLAITEWGNFTNYNLDAAGIYTADLLGAFGKNNVYMGNYFGRLMGFTAGAFKIFRNYNGTNGRFGNTSVQTTSSDNSKITVYSAIQDANETKLNLVMINRSGTPEEVAITLTAGTGISYKTAEVFAMEAGNAGQIIQKDGISTISQNQITYTLPSHSVYHLVFDASEPLPVTLTSFTGEMYENNSVLLKWKTTSEIHVDIFEIERADNGKDFEVIRTEKSSGGESGADYQYVDRELSSGTYYYRLKSIDLDKSFAFSKIVSVRVEATDELHIAPSPTQTSFKITNLEGEPPYKIQVYEKTGKLVLNENVMKRDQEINIEKLKSGIYIVKINDRQVRKLIISR
jgi:hypothetical protein